MGPTRTPYGRAFGFVNQFNYRGTTAGDVSGQTTPDVSLGELFYVNNTAAVNITNFILSDTANRGVNYEGKIIRIVSLNSSTTVGNSAAVVLQGTSQLGTANAYIDLMYSNKRWLQVGGGVPNGSDFTTVTLGTAGGATVHNGTRFVMFQGVSGAQQLKALSGGYIGQTVGILSPAASNSGGITVYVMTGGNLIFPGTNMVAVQTNAGISFTKVANNDWRYMQPGTAGLIN